MDASSGGPSAPANPPTRFDGMAVAKGLPERPGVYRFLDAQRAPVYVGKAKNLRKRVISYFQSSRQHGPKIIAMLAQVRDLDITITHTENEALILENNLIKEFRPRYNVVLRDDKSYPYVYLSSEQEFPRLRFHRGPRKGKGRYYGPYASAGAVRDTLNLLQKLFLLRNCDDSFFSNRSRPCLQHQIQRCTAPCVGLIDNASYGKDVQQAQMVLEGRDQEVIERLGDDMDQASKDLAFERAARYRDRIKALQRVQQRQYITAKAGDCDIVACLTRNGIGCVQVFFIRNGRNLGSRSFFPDHTQDADATNILAAFVSQFYLAERADRHVPSEIIVNEPLQDVDLLSQVLSQKRQRKVSIRHRVRAERARWLAMAIENADMALRRRLSSTAGQQKRMDALSKVMAVDEPIERIECFDVSHTRGEATVASCVVFGPDGPIKSDYRRYNIKDIQPGDDYAAMHQALLRRYTRVTREEGKLPEVLLIDGGKGQIAQAAEVLQSLQIVGVCIVGVAKGPTRKPGLETLVVCDGSAAPRLRPDSAALHLIQQVRDEAHRFAITGHRQQRGRARNTSPLEAIEGVGPKRRRQLIKHFGGIQGVTRAGVEDLVKVSGISNHLAVKLYQSFHGGP